MSKHTQDHFFAAKTCDRCGDPLRARTMSKFNRDTLCMACKQAERECPGYIDADDAEVAAVRGGDYNFPGVGLTARDREFLALRLAERRAREAQAHPEADAASA